MLLERDLISVCIAEDSELFGLALRQILVESNGLELLGEIVEPSLLFDTLRSLNPRVLLSKLSFLQPDVGRSVSRLKKEFPQTAIVMMLSNPEELADSLSSNVDGYILRESPAHFLIMALKITAAGNSWLAPEIAKYVLQGKGRVRIRLLPPEEAGSPLLEILTPKEREVMRLIMDGMTNAAIAQELNLSVETVRVHVKHILKKMGARDRSEAINTVLAWS